MVTGNYPPVIAVRDIVRERPFNLKGGGFPEFNIRLYDKNSESDYLFFPPPKSEYFFQQHWESEYFF
jgi:hypothetical protein